MSGASIFGRKRPGLDDDTDHSLVSATSLPSDSSQNARAASLLAASSASSAAQQQVSETAAQAGSLSAAGTPSYAGPTASTVPSAAPADPPTLKGAPTESATPKAFINADGKVEILVQLNAGAGTADIAKTMKVFGAQVEDIIRAAGDGHGELITISVAPQAQQAVLDALANNPNVTFAEPNWVQSIQLAQVDDPSYKNGSLWGMYGNTTSPASTYGSQAGEAWGNYDGSRSVIIGDIDTGIDYTHQDLYLNIWLNQKEISSDLRDKLTDVDGDGLITFWDLNNVANAAHVSDLNGNGRIDAGDLLNDIRWENGIDEDGNNLKDDLIGWDYANDDNDPFDDAGHGTHTSGTIGAISNTTGVIGVSPEVQIMALKFLGANGSGSTSAALQCIDYYTWAATSGQLGDFVATSNSWGGGGYSQALLDSIVRAAVAKILFVAAAGNGGNDSIGDNNDTTANYPSNYSTIADAGYEAVIAVAALTSSGSLASFSNYGLSSVDLAAPGSGIVSTVPGGGYATYSGTSMATPHVAGALALLASAFPTATAEQLRDALLASVIDISGLATKIDSGGTLDVNSAITALGAMMVPSVSIATSTTSITEGNSGSKAVTFTISISSQEAISGTVTVGWELDYMGSAQTDDFTGATSTPGIVTLSQTDRSATVTIIIAGDTTWETNEQFKVKLTSTSNLNYPILRGEAIVTIRNDDDDFANTINTSGSVTLNAATAKGALDFTGDLDAFKVTLEAGKTYQFDLASTASGFDPMLYLRNSSYTQVASNDDRTSGVLDSRIVFTATSSGTYYLEAGAYNNASMGSYTLTAIGDKLISGGDGNDTISGGTALSDRIDGGTGADVMTGGAARDTFIFKAGDSVYDSGTRVLTADRITDFAKSQDVIDYSSALSRGGSLAGGTATFTEASINQTTSIVTFAKNSGTTLADALSDITTRFTKATDSAGEFALFQVNKTGSYYVFISDGAAGLTSGDVLVRLDNITTIRSGNLTSGGDLIIA